MSQQWHHSSITLHSDLSVGPVKLLSSSESVSATADLLPILNGAFLDSFWSIHHALLVHTWEVSHVSAIVSKSWHSLEHWRHFPANNCDAPCTCSAHCAWAPRHSPSSESSYQKFFVIYCLSFGEMNKSSICMRSLTSNKELKGSAWETRQKEPFNENG